MELIDELTTAINCAQSHTSMCNRAVEAMEHAIRFIEAEGEPPKCDVAANGLWCSTHKCHPMNCPGTRREV